MTNDKPIPKNFSQLSERIFQKCYGWFIKLNKYIKAALLFLVLIVLFFSARVGIFGEGFQNLTFVVLRIPVLPTDKKWIDAPPTANRPATEKERGAGKGDDTPVNSTSQSNQATSLPAPGKKDIKGEVPAPRIAVNINFTVNDIQGQIGKTYFSGDNVTLFFRTDQDCYLLLVCVDKNRVTSLLGKKPEPQFIKAGATDEMISFVLDQTTGTEFYYAIACKANFDFEKVIRPAIQKMLTETGSKGPDFAHKLDLDDHRYFQKHLYFNHR